MARQHILTHSIGMRNSNFVYVLKMEYVPKINIFGLKMMVTKHHNFFFEIPPCGKKVLFITEFAILGIFMKEKKIVLRMEEFQNIFF